MPEWSVGVDNDLSKMSILQAVFNYNGAFTTVSALFTDLYQISTEMELDEWDIRISHKCLFLGMGSHILQCLGIRKVHGDW